jgi:hypothetical protein
MVLKRNDLSSGDAVAGSEGGGGGSPCDGGNDWYRAGDAECDVPWFDKNEGGWCDIPGRWSDMTYEVDPGRAAVKSDLAGVPASKGALTLPGCCVTGDEE